MARATIAIRTMLSSILAGGLAGGLAAASLCAATPAAAQNLGNSGCADIQKTLTERKDLVASANSSAGAKKKISAPAACALFTKLQANGVAGMKWIEANQEWCSIPQSFADGFKSDHARVIELRNKICAAAAQQAAMERKARQQAQNGGGGGGSGGLLGGPGLTGSSKMPQGAL